MINAFCNYDGAIGVAVHARCFLNAIRKLEPVTLLAWDTVSDAAHLNPSDPCIGIGSVEQIAQMPGSRRYPFVVWEPTIFPKDQLRILRGFEEIWVPSEWGRTVLLDNGIPAAKVFVVPEGVDPDVFRPAEPLSKTDRTYRFLCVGKWEARKNVVQLIQAFTQEFRPGERVELVLHCFNSHNLHLDLEAKVRHYAAQPHAPVRISRPVPGENIADLYTNCDAFVLPTRAEGWGLPIMEAMSCGLPAIVTNYSAPTDFLNETNGYPLRVAEMVDVYDPYFYPATWDLGKWAQPDLEDLRGLIRHVYQNQGEAREKGRLARASVLSRWTWDHAARIAYRRLRQSRHEAA